MTRRDLAIALTLAAAALAVACAGGCTTLVITKRPDGSVKAEYYSVGKDKTLQGLDVVTSGGSSVKVEGASSTVNPAVNDIAAAARAVAERAGGLP